MNKITNWLEGKPTKSGFYMICSGDVESPRNLSLQSIYKADDGELIDSDFKRISDYHQSIKFAELDFSHED